MSDAGGTRLTVDDDDLHPTQPAQNPLAPYGYEQPNAGYYPPLRADQDHRYPWQTEDWRTYASGLPRLAEKAGGSVYTKPSDVFGAAAEAAGKYGAHLAHGLWQAGPGTLQRVMTGELQPGTREFNEAAANTALAYGVLGLPIPRPYGSLGIFGGPLSRTAPLSKLSEARGMEYEARRQLQEKGVPYNKDDFRDPIFEHTGWAKDASGQWNYIIPDAGAELINIDTHPMMRTHEYQSPLGPDKNQTWYAPKFDFSGTQKLTVGDILKHDYLYKGYPDLKDIKVQPTGVFDSSLGAYSSKTNTIYLGLNTKENMLSVLMHELNHAVQHREGFPRGGSMDEFLPHDFGPTMTAAQERMNNLNEELRGKGINPYVFRQYHGIGEHAAPDRRYISLGDQATIQTEVPRNFLADYKIAMAEHSRLNDMKTEAFQKYQNLIGEVQSRATQAMLHSRRWDRPAWEIGELSWDSSGQHKIVPYTPEHEQIYRPQWDPPPPPYGKQPQAPTMPRPRPGSPVGNPGTPPTSLEPQ